MPAVRGPLDTPPRAAGLEMEFLDINLTQDSSLFLHAVHSLCTGEFLKKSKLFSGFKNTVHTKKIRDTRKLEFCRKEK
jgi:hypothetical protein